MAAVDADEYVSSDSSRKRMRSLEPGTADEQPTPKIKLSLKLGALRRQESPACDPRNGAESDENVDIGGEAVHTPRIRLRLSLKKANADQTPVVHSPVPISGTESDRHHNGINSYLNEQQGDDSYLNGQSGYLDKQQGDDSYLDIQHDDSRGYLDGSDDGTAPPETPINMPRRRGRPPQQSRRSSSVGRQTSTPPTGVLTTTVTLKSSLQRLVRRIRKRDSYGFFLEPVDTEAVPDYLSVISQPMDLGTMQAKVEAEEYRSINEFRSDLLLVCANARKYNGTTSIYAKAADRVQEYALVAIARETAKLERVGRASLPARTESVSPARISDGSDMHMLSTHDHSTEYRRSTRLRRRNSVDLQQPTATSIVDGFRWSAAARKKTRRAAVPKRHTDAQKISLAADGSIDAAVFEEDAGCVPYERGPTELPLLVGIRASRLIDGRPLFAHGRHYAPASQLDFGAFRTQPPASDTPRALTAVHGDALGLAYWRSIAEFIDGAGPDVAQYAADVMDHLSDGTHVVARDALACLSAPERTGPLAAMVSWLDSRPERERLAAERAEALTKPLLLRDVSARCARAADAGSRPSTLSPAQRRDLFAANVRALKRMHELQQAGKEIPQDELDDLDTHIYTLAEQACLAACNSALPTTPLPRPASRPAPVPRFSLPPRPSRAVSTPTLPALHSASLASAVRSELMDDLA
ncbi:hypothetical protein IWW36_004964 [Coemansia brasiliensis]|uniref:Bromo domain-containing protein n=1 Tax=Coemansia brasiliensis TaxID=2650707 RepID=A0A9W8I2I2_9FUNG|nr:hypothetical protein IWW36_004964 [Coemansia brasiliensis]